MLWRRLPEMDEARFWAAFSSALRATGIDPEGREAGFLEGGTESSFHYVVWGTDALDCHAYASPPRECYELGYLDLGSLRRGPADLQQAWDEAGAVMWVESAPMIDIEDATQGRRVALAVAGLIDGETLALWEYRTRRLVPCGPETADLLRRDWERVFDGGIVVTSRA